MTIQTINLGNYANDGTGDDLRTAFTKVNSNFTMLSATASAIGGANLGTGQGLFVDLNPNTLNLEFKTLTSTDSSVTFTSTAHGLDLSVIPHLAHDPSPTLEANLNLNNYNVTGGDVQTTVYGYDLPIENNIFATMLTNNPNLIFDLGSVTQPVGYQHFPKGYVIDFNGYGVSSGFTSPLKNDYDFGTFVNTVGTQIGGNILTLNGNLTTQGGNISIVAPGSSNITLPASGTLAVTNNPLNQFASTTSAQLASVISDETGTGVVVFNTNPTLAGTVSISNQLQFADGSTLTSAAGLAGSSSIVNGAYAVTIQNTGILTVPGAIQFSDGTTLSSTSGIIPGQSGNSGKFLTTNGTAISWGAVSQLVNGSYTVSVNSSGALVFPDTTTQTSAYPGTGSEAQYTVLAGPSNGAGFPQYRLLVAGDIPSTLGATTFSGTLTATSPVFVTSATTTSTTFNLYNTTATTVNALGAATAISIGAATGTLTVNNPTLVGSTTTQNVFNTVATTVNIAGAATTVSIGSSTGTTTVNNNIASTGNYIHSINASVSATGGTTQPTATALTKDVNIVTAANANNGVALPAGVAGMVIYIYNSTATTINIYPVNGGSAKINALTTNSAYTLAGTTGVRFVCSSNTQWYAF